MKKNGSALVRPLARPGDPYMRFGKLIEPDVMVHDEKVVVQNVTPDTFRPTKRRDAKDLPAPVKVVNAIACVFMYSVYGLGDREIAEAMKVKVVDIEKIRRQVAYKECFETVVSEFINANSELVTARIAAYSHGALSQVANIAFNGEEEKNRLRASGDILDRGGYAPRENAARGAAMNKNDLRIVVVKAERDVEVSVDGEAV